MKYTRFQDIPEFTRGGSYNVTVDWKFLESHLENWDCPNMGSPLILNPDFQRHHIWTVDKQIKFVEFCLRGGQSSRHHDINFLYTFWGMFGSF